jgi:hypothetical protein
MENSQIRAPANGGEEKGGVTPVHIGGPLTSVQRGHVRVEFSLLPTVHYVLPQSRNAEATGYERDEHHQAPGRETAAS